MTRPASDSQARLSPGQTIGWLVAFLVLAVLIGMMFAYDTAARPLFGAGGVGAGASWPLS